MFNEKDHITKYKVHEEKLVSYFQKKGIVFSNCDNDVTLKNVIFSGKGKEFKISYHSFYRFSGISSLYKEGEDRKLEVIRVTDEMYLNTFIKPIIELYFDIK